MSIEMQEAYTKDMAEIKMNGDYNYIEDNEDADIPGTYIETEIPQNQEENTTTKEESIEVTEEQPQNIGNNDSSVDSFFN